MGAIAGPITFTTYYATTEIAKDHREAFLAGLRRQAFTPIDVDLDHDDAIGWVNINDPTSSDFNVNDVYWGSYLIATIRHDAIKLPPTSVKIQLQKAIREHLAKTGKEKLSKSETEELREVLIRNLKRKALPSTKTFDMVWNLDTGVVWFWCASKKVNEAFTDLFQETFGHQPNMKCPYSELERLDFDDDHLQRICEMEPANLAAPSGRG